MTEQTKTVQADYDFGPGIFRLKRTDYIRLLTWRDLYDKILGLHGDILIFGVGWGRDMLIASRLRALLEPDYPRRVIGFDTFAGVPEEDIIEDDGPKAVPGYNKPPDGWINDMLGPQLQAATDDHPSSDGIGAHLIEGRVQKTVPEFLERDQCAIALAYIDFTIMEPTRFVLEAIEDRLLRGSVVAFNQFNTPYWNCESQALRETWGLRSGTMHRDPYHRYGGHLVIE